MYSVYVSVNGTQLLYYLKSVLDVTDILGISRVEGEVADCGNKTVNTAGEYCSKDVRESSGGVSLGLQAGVIDNKATYPTEKEG